jgi:hypothetical protein
MFCNRCGSQLQPNPILCPACGRRLGDPTGAVAQARLERHLRTLGMLWMAVGGLFLIPALGLMLFGSGLHVVVHNSEPFSGFFPFFLYLAGGSFMILGAGGICVGLGLNDRRPWARTAAIILGVLSLFHPPFGTALGVYTLWVLLADEHGTEYAYLARPA